MSSLMVPGILHPQISIHYELLLVMFAFSLQIKEEGQSSAHHLSRRAQRLTQTVLKAPTLLRTAARQQEPPLTPPPSSCPTTSLSSVGTPPWRSSMVSCTCTRPSKSRLINRSVASLLLTFQRRFYRLIAAK